MKIFMSKDIKMKKSTLLFFIVLLPLFLISAFRDGLGTDYYAYANIYRFPETFKDEFLFKFIFITLPRLISKNEIFFFLLTSFIISFYFLKTIFDYSQIVFLSVIIYISQFYFISYNAIRQFIVIAVFLYFSLKFLRDKQLFYYICLIIVLAQIHFSIYIMLLFPILGNNNFRIKTYWIIWAIVFLLFVLQSNNIISLSSIFQYVPGLSVFSSKFDTIQAGGEYFFGKYQSNNQLIIKNIFFIMFLYRLRHFNTSDAIYWFNLFLFGLILQNLLVKFSLFAIRIAYFGDIAIIFLVPVFIRSFSNRKLRFVFVTIFILYFFLSFYTRFVINGESEVFKQGVEWMN